MEPITEQKWCCRIQELFVISTDKADTMLPNRTLVFMVHIVISVIKGRTWDTDRIEETGMWSKRQAASRIHRAEGVS
jgi:hypothetical protein